MAYKINEISKMFGLSRTAILYYDKIGLLSPSSRTDTGYRIYSESDVERLRSIVLYRNMGVSLAEIKTILKHKDVDTTVLENTLLKLEEQIKQLKDKQQTILKMMNMHHQPSAMNKESFTAAMYDIGMSEEQTMAFHKVFEGNDARSHRAFLAFLGLRDDEIEDLLKNL